MAYGFTGQPQVGGQTELEAAKAKQEAAKQMMEKQNQAEGETRAATSQGAGSLLGGIIGALVAGIPTAGAGAAAGFAAGSAIGGAAGGLAGEAMKEKPNVGKALQQTAALGSSIAGGMNTFGDKSAIAGIKNAGETDIMGKAGNKVSGSGVKGFA
jgi:hypothetical protein